MLQVDVWSDYVCPFCWLEVPVLDALKTRLGDQVNIDWHAFELRPEPAPTLDPAGDYLTDIWARAVYPMARERGMRLALPPVQPRSRLALEAAEHARAEGRFDAMHRAIFRAFFEDGHDIGDLDVLLELAHGVDLRVDGLATALRFGTHTEAVLADERLAEALGVTGVPLIVFRPAGAGWDDAVGLSGAQGEERVMAVAQRVLQTADKAEGRSPGAPTVQPSTDDPAQGPSCAA